MYMSTFGKIPDWVIEKDLIDQWKIKQGWWLIVIHEWVNVKDLVNSICSWTNGCVWMKGQVWWKN
jgi:hypothetical protein